MSEPEKLPERYTLTNGLVFERHKAGPYYYRITNTGHSSDRYGPCEMCKQDVSRVYYQSEARAYPNKRRDTPGQEGIGLTHHECSNYFGHMECLVSARR